MHIDLEQHRLPRAGNDAPERLLAAMPVAKRRLELTGVSTAVLEGGDGPPVVLLHDPGAMATEWMCVIANAGNQPNLEQPEAFLEALRPELGR